MIGKSEWFERRKYGGWGITPKTWQGYVYIIGFVVSLSFFMALPIWDLKTRYIILGVWLLVFFADVIDIMRNMKKDERKNCLIELNEEKEKLYIIDFDTKKELIIIKKP